MNRDTRSQLSVSQTTLNLLRDCPRCFWLHLRAGQPRPRSPWPSLVRALEGIIDAYWDGHARNGAVPPLVAESIRGVPVRPNLEAWYDRETGLYLVGRLDACVKTDDWFFAPVDHKTRGSVPDTVHDAYVLQLDVYHLLLEKNGYPPAGFGYLDFYTPEGDIDTGMNLEVSVVQIETKSERAANWLALAASVLDRNEAPPAALDCVYCMWAQAKPWF